MRRYTLVACARWESNDIVEWASYHLSIGFDHIVLYCNDDDPAELFEKVYPFLVGPTPSMTFHYYPFQGHQWHMYMHYLNNFKDETNWVSFLDIDEFLCLKKHDMLADFIDSFSAQSPDCIFFNWLNFGNDGHVTRPVGPVLSNYSRREEQISTTTKLIVRTEKINLTWMQLNKTPFWHGVGREHFIGRVFTWDARSINVLGDDASLFLSGEDPDLYISSEGRSSRIMDTAYIAHYFIKSEEDFLIRAKRGLAGDFSQQTKYKHALETGLFREILDKANAAEELFPAQKARSLNKRVQQTYLLPSPGYPNCAIGKPAMQSSVSEWSSSADAKEDAAGGVNGTHTGRYQFHTAIEDTPWWSLNLLAPHDVYEVRLYAGFENEDKLLSFRIETSDDAMNWQVIFENSATGVDQVGFGGIDGSPLQVVLSPPVAFQYLRVLKTEPGLLRLDQVEVFGIKRIPRFA